MIVGLILLVSAVASLEAHIEISADSVIAAINPELLGSGDEMNEDFSQLGLDDCIKYTGIPLLRMGGVASEYLDWEANDYNGAWYVDFVDSMIWVDPLEFGIDSLLQFSERTGVEPVLTVNFQINDPGKAARLVEYCNGEVSSPMGSLRAQRGHADPYNVTYWCIGNEPDISGMEVMLGDWRWTFYRHFGIPFDQWTWEDSSFATATEFADLVEVYIDSMRSSSPIPIEIGGLSLASNLSWIGPVIGGNHQEIDWMDIHYYPNASFESDSTMYAQWLAAPEAGGNSIVEPFSDWYEMVCATVEEVSGENEIPVHIFEYGGGMILTDDHVWWNYIEGLFLADAIGHFARAGVQKAAAYSIYEGRPDSDEFPLFGKIRGDTLSTRLGGHVLHLYNRFFSGSLVQARSDGEGLGAYACLPQNDTLTVFIVNKNLDNDFSADISLRGFLLQSTMEVWDIRNDTTFAAPFNGTTGIVHRGIYTVDPMDVNYTFPKASVTVLRFAPEQSSGETAPGDPLYQIRLIQNQPNPFSRRTDIVFSIPHAGFAELQIFDIAGRNVKTLLADQIEKGTYTMVWDGSDESNELLYSGTYFCRLQFEGGKSDLKRITLIR